MTSAHRYKARLEVRASRAKVVIWRENEVASQRAVTGDPLNHFELRTTQLASADPDDHARFLMGDWLY